MNFMDIEGIAKLLQDPEEETKAASKAQLTPASFAPTKKYEVTPGDNAAATGAPSSGGDPKDIWGAGEVAEEEETFEVN